MARERVTDPRRIDVHAYAAAAASLSGEMAQRELARLSEGLLALPGDTLPPPVHWSAAGEQRTAAGGGTQTWLRLRADTAVTLQCQRCLQPMTQALVLDHAFRFVDGEDEAARLDEDGDDDVLAASRSFDLIELLEDELILALPLVPRHEVCAQPLPTGAADDGADAPAENPFAALAALRRTGGG